MSLERSSFDEKVTYFFIYCRNFRKGISSTYQLLLTAQFSFFQKPEIALILQWTLVKKQTVGWRKNKTANYAIRQKCTFHVTSLARELTTAFLCWHIPIKEMVCILLPNFWDHKNNLFKQWNFGIIFRTEYLLNLSNVIN